jgi:hypothetical protein
MDRKIEEYSLNWDSNVSKGEVVLRLDDQQRVRIRADSLADLAGLAVLLNQRPVFVSDDNQICTGPQKPGD